VAGRGVGGGSGGGAEWGLSGITNGLRGAGGRVGESERWSGAGAR